MQVESIGAMSISTPLVSIIIPTYNRENSVQRAIASAQAQSYSNIEIIVTDNASTDRTAEVVGLMARSDPRIRYYRYEQNIGPVGNWWRGVDLARGEYIKILFSDDWLDEACIEKMLQPLIDAESMKVSLVYSDCIICNHNDQILCTTELSSGYQSSEHFILGYLDNTSPLTPSACIFRTEDARKYFCHSYVGQDHFFFQRGIGNDAIWLWRIARSLPYVYYSKEYLVHLSSTSQGEPSITAHTSKKMLHRGYDRAFIQFISELKDKSSFSRQLKIAFCNKGKTIIGKMDRFIELSKAIGFSAQLLLYLLIRKTSKTCLI